MKAQPATIWVPCNKLANQNNDIDTRWHAKVLKLTFSPLYSYSCLKKMEWLRQRFVIDQRIGTQILSVAHIKKILRHNGVANMAVKRNTGAAGGWYYYAVTSLHLYCPTGIMMSFFLCRERCKSSHDAVWRCKSPRRPVHAYLFAFVGSTMCGVSSVTRLHHVMVGRSHFLDGRRQWITCRRQQQTWWVHRPTIATKHLLNGTMLLLESCQTTAFHHLNKIQAHIK